MELLVVVAILALLAAFAMPALSSTLRASQLNTAEQALTDLLSLARQTAISRNLPVEVRIFQLPASASSAESATSWKAVQAFVLDGTHAVPLGRMQMVSAPVCAALGPGESTLLDDAVLPLLPGADPLPIYGQNYTWKSFLFKPDGGTSLPHTNVYLTFVLEKDRPLTQGGNYVTVQIDPLTGRARSFRP